MNRKILVFAVLAFVLVLSACNLPSNMPTTATLTVMPSATPFTSFFYTPPASTSTPAQFASGISIPKARGMIRVEPFAKDNKIGFTITLKSTTVTISNVFYRICIDAICDSEQNFTHVPAGETYLQTINIDLSKGSIFELYVGDTAVAWIKSNGEMSTPFEQEIK